MSRELECLYDGRKSFYKKAIVEDNGKDSKLYSYDTLVAEVKNGEPIIYGLYSQTTKRHIVEYLRQEFGYDMVDVKGLKYLVVKEENND